MEMLGAQNWTANIAKLFHTASACAHARQILAFAWTRMPATPIYCCTAVLFPRTQATPTRLELLLQQLLLLLLLLLLLACQLGPEMPGCKSRQLNSSKTGSIFNLKPGTKGQVLCAFPEQTQKKAQSLSPHTIAVPHAERSTRDLGGSP